MHVTCMHCLLIKKNNIMLNKLIEKLEQEKEETKNFIFERAKEKDEDNIESLSNKDLNENLDKELDKLLDVNMESKYLESFTSEMMENHNFDLAKYLTLEKVILQLKEIQKEFEAKIKKKIEEIEINLIERVEAVTGKISNSENGEKIKELIFDLDMTNELTSLYDIDDYRNHCFDIGARYGLMDLLNELKKQ